jgi:hypothetical protein
LSSAKVDPALFDLGVRDRPVDLVEVDCVHPEPRKACLDLASKGVAPQALLGRPPRTLGLAALREHVRTLALAERGESAPHHLLGVPEAVLRGRVDPVDAELERVVDRGERVLVVLRAPAPVVLGPADRPRAEAGAGDLEAGVA